jgi:hypothetical protein
MESRRVSVRNATSVFTEYKDGIADIAIHVLTAIHGQIVNIVIRASTRT